MMLALWMACIRFCRNDLERFDYARHNFVCNAGILAFGVLADNHQINAGISGGQGRKIANWTNICVELKLLAKRNVDAGEAAADRRCNRALEPYARALDGFDQRLGNVFLVSLESISPGVDGFPFNLYARCVQYSDGRACDLRTNAIARN